MVICVWLYVCVRTYVINVLIKSVTKITLCTLHTYYEVWDRVSNYSVIKYKLFSSRTLFNSTRVYISYFSIIYSYR